MVSGGELNSGGHHYTKLDLLVGTMTIYFVAMLCYGSERKAVKSDPS